MIQIVKQKMKIKEINNNEINRVFTLFFAFLLSLSYNSFAQKNGTGVTPIVESIEPDSKQKKEIEKNDNKATDLKLKENVANNVSTANVWSDYKMAIQEGAALKFNINIDSLYQSYAAQRFFVSDDESEIFQVKIIPNAALVRLLNTDTILYRYIKVQNILFSSLTVSSNKIAIQTKKFFPVIADLSKDFKITTFQLFNNVFPPVLVGKPEINLTYYQRLIDNYFTSNPEVIYYCSNDFLKMLVKKQYALMYSLHKESSNAVKATN